jgi:hypothetical protein
VAETSSVEPTGVPEEGVDLQKKKEDEIKKIDITQCFGPAFCLTNQKWRPSYVLASKENTLVLKASIADVEALMTVSYWPS